MGWTEGGTGGGTGRDGGHEWGIPGTRGFPAPGRGTRRMGMSEGQGCPEGSLGGGPDPLFLLTPSTEDHKRRKFGSPKGQDCDIPGEGDQHPKERGWGPLRGQDPVPQGWDWDSQRDNSSPPLNWDSLEDKVTRGGGVTTPGLRTVPGPPGGHGGVPKVTGSGPHWGGPAGPPLSPRPSQPGQQPGYNVTCDLPGGHRQHPPGPPHPKNGGEIPQNPRYEGLR